MLAKPSPIEKSNKREPLTSHDAAHAHRHRAYFFVSGNK